MIKNDSLKVLTYNVQQKVDSPGRRSDCLFEMAATIREQDPDVFGTQEDTRQINGALMENLPGYASSEGAQYYEQANAIRDYVYWKTDRFNLLEKGHRFMSDTPDVRSKFPDSNAYRGFNYLLLEVRESGKRFLFVNLHTDYYGFPKNVSTADPVRAKQLAVLSAFLKKYHEENLPIVVLGDFNASPGAESVASFEKDNPRLKMAMRTAGTLGDTDGSLVGGEFTKRQNHLFDQIFVTEDRIHTRFFGVIDNVKDGKYPSDHLPVVAHLEIC